MTHQLTHRTPCQIIIRDLVQARIEVFHACEDLAAGHPPPEGFEQRVLGSCALASKTNPELDRIARHLQAKRPWTKEELAEVLVELNRALAVLGVAA
jgi:hypothetical protein